MADDIIARARALIGVRFRFQGRDADGIDCVGLVAHACQLAPVPADYDIRSADVPRWAALLDTFFVRCRGPMTPGSVLMMQAGPMQLHLGLWTGESLIHADARLRHVVETPGPPSWPVIGCWAVRQAQIVQKESRWPRSF